MNILDESPLIRHEYTEIEILDEVYPNYKELIKEVAGDQRFMMTYSCSCGNRYIRFRYHKNISTQCGHCGNFGYPIKTDTV